MDKRIVYTRKSDGGVSICCPAEWTVHAMCHGGAWREMPWFYPGFDEVQIERQIAAGISPAVARRYAAAMMIGGCTTAEALEIIRDRDCTPHGTAIELWDVSDVPNDRWFRDAWRRSHNGGPISVDLKLAKPIQWQRARAFVETENKRRADELDCPGLIEVNWDKLRARIRSARCEVELKSIWPAQ